MIASNSTQKIRDAIAERIGVREAEQGVYIVDIPWSYPDGDQCRVFLSKSNNGNWNATDGGTSVMRAAEAANVDVMGRGYIDRFRQILELYRLTDDEGELLANDQTDLTDAVFSVAQASIDVVHLSRMPKEKEHSQESTFDKRLGRLIESVVSANNLQKNWTDEKNDSDGFYPVSYRIDPSHGSPIFVLGVESVGECVHATMSCLFHKSIKTKFRGAAVFADQARLRGKREVARLQKQVDVSFSSLAKSDEIKQFLDKASV